MKRVKRLHLARAEGLKHEPCPSIVRLWTAVPVFLRTEQDLPHLHASSKQAAESTAQAPSESGQTAPYREGLVMAPQCPVRVYANSELFFICLKCKEVGLPKWPATVESLQAQKRRFVEGHQHKGGNVIERLL